MSARVRKLSREEKLRVIAFNHALAEALNDAVDAIERADLICDEYLENPNKGMFGMTWHKLRTTRGLLKAFVWEFNCWCKWTLRDFGRKDK